MQTNSGNLTITGNLLANLAIGSGDDAFASIANDLVSVGSALVGQTPPESLEYNTNDEPYIILSCLPPAESGATATVDCQLKSLKHFICHLQKNLYFAGDTFETISNETNANCSCFNTTKAENLIQLWANLSIAIEATVVINGDSVLTQINGTLSKNITVLINETRLVLEGINNCTSCLVDAAIKNQNRMIVICPFFDKSHERCAKRRRDGFKNHVKLVGIQARYVARNGRRAVSRALKNMFKVGRRASANFNTRYINFKNAVGAGCSYTDIRNNVNSVASTFQRLQILLSGSIDIVINKMNSTCNSTDLKKNETLTNGTTVIGDSSTNLTDKIANENYTSCQHHANLTLTIVANYSSEVTICAVEADTATNNAQTKSFSFISSLNATFESHESALLNCYISSCGIFAFSLHGPACINQPVNPLFYYILFWPYITPTGTNFINCVKNVSS